MLRMVQEGTGTHVGRVHWETTGGLGQWSGKGTVGLGTVDGCSCRLEEEVHPQERGHSGRNKNAHRQWKMWLWCMWTGRMVGQGTGQVRAGRRISEDMGGHSTGLDECCACGDAGCWGTCKGVEGHIRQLVCRKVVGSARIDKQGQLHVPRTGWSLYWHSQGAGTRRWVPRASHKYPRKYTSMGRSTLWIDVYQRWVLLGK